MSNIIDTTIRYLEEKWPGRFIINFFGYLVILVPIALGYVIIKKGMKLKSNDNDKLWVQFKNFMSHNQINPIKSRNPGYLNSRIQGSTQRGPRTRAGRSY